MYTSIVSFVEYMRAGGKAMLRYLFKMLEQKTTSTEPILHPFKARMQSCPLQNSIGFVLNPPTAAHYYS